ncbi:MAG: UDP-3-O-(3-hydroxymyristoyl)glucosamine N-acyltransferase [Candidatus Omnitrophica bacterium]|nr:UDP-3-O-(3-hydroxymyristoyl)glucosamine N-acyltransferase [Candidatus Omnitrophota bacterium]MBU1784536.1 UDP-3-O-(3-hydroxymyristoyl)glucosamine N-acyltransferase [Candidatus Omnitrophota bacterium]
MMRLKEIAALLDATLQGDGELEISGLTDVRFASPGDLTFAADKDQLNAAKESDATCVLTALAAKNYPKPALKVKDIKIALTTLYNVMISIAPTVPGGIHSTAVISGSAVIGKNVSIGPYVVIGNNTKIGDSATIDAHCVIGKEVRIGEKNHMFPGVKIYDRSVTGKNVIIHAGSVIGADGFGYIPKDGKIFKVPQLGQVIIGDDVEIGANTCIDKGAFSDTVIGESTKIDNLVQIGHNVRIGRNVLIAAQLGIGGSSSIGDNTMTGGQAGVSDHTHIGDNVKVAAQAGVIRDVKSGATIFGYPARDARETMKKEAVTWWVYRNIEQIRNAIKHSSNKTSTPEEK